MIDDELRAALDARQADQAVDPVDERVAEIRDLEVRIAATRTASRPTEPLEYAYTIEQTQAGAVRRGSITPQGHILSALSELERRRVALIGSK